MRNGTEERIITVINRVERNKQVTSHTLRILIFSTFYEPYEGGAEVALKNIFERLASRHNIHIVTPLRSDDLPRKEDINGIHVHRVGQGKESDTKRYMLAGATYAKKLHKEEPFDVFYVMMANQAGVAGQIFNVMTKRQIPSVLELQSGDSIDYIKQHIPKGFWWLYKRIYRDFHRIIAISEHLAGRAKNFGGQQVCVIPNGIDTDLFKPLRTKTKVRKRYGLKKNDVLVITTSRLAHKNNVDGLIRAVLALPDNYHLLIAGDGDQEGRLKILAKDDPRIHFLGKVRFEKQPELLSGSDIFVRPSRSEGFGNSFIEAMGCGLPIIGTKVGGIPDFLEDRETGLFCTTRPMSIARTIQELAEDEKLYKHIAGQVRKIAEQYDWDDIAKQVEQELLEAAR